MSIELKQAAQQALDAFEAFGEADDFATLFTLTQKMNALRTAIQQAESDPVAFGIRASNTGRICQFVSSDDEYEVAQLGEYRKGSVVPLYTHPAPGVPDDVARDAERYRWLRATTNWASSNGERIDVSNNPELWDSAIDAAMLAASPAQKGGA